MMERSVNMGAIIREACADARARRANLNRSVKSDDQLAKSGKRKSSVE